MQNSLPDGDKSIFGPSPNDRPPMGARRVWSPGSATGKKARQTVSDDFRAFVVQDRTTVCCGTDYVGW